PYQPNSRTIRDRAMTLSPKLPALVVLALTSLVLAGCGSRVEVPPAAVGKVMTAEGYKDTLYHTSRFRLAPCWPGQACQKLVLLSVADFQKSENIHLFIPKDRLEMNFSLKLTLTVNPDKYAMLFNKITPKALDGYRALISLDKAYKVYAQPIIATESRDFLSHYSIDEIAGNRDTVITKLAR